VDEFKAKPPPGCTGFFLSHFHADHYGGLTKSFGDGQIYCSQATANLVVSKLRVAKTRLCPLPLGVATEIAGVLVTLIDANHCPGSVVFLFELPDGRKHLHTGDFRYTPDLLDAHDGLLRKAANVPPFLPLLQPDSGSSGDDEGSAAPPTAGAAANKIGFTTVYLDTTYCDPTYTFPTQAAAVNFCVAAARSEGFNDSSTLFLVGSYTIGKEKVMLALSKAMDKPIYVEPAKHKILSQLEMPPEDFARFTTDASATNLACAKLHELSLGALRGRKRKPHGGKMYTTIVAFKPTGWSMGRSRGGGNGGGQRKKQKQQKLSGAGPSTMLGMADGVSKQQRDGCILYGVPYSEHSSYTELCEFIAATRPRRIVPTVNNHNPTKVNEMLQLLQPPPLPTSHVHAQPLAGATAGSVSAAASTAGAVAHAQGQMTALEKALAMAAAAASAESDRDAPAGCDNTTEENESPPLPGQSGQLLRDEDERGQVQRKDYHDGDGDNDDDNDDDDGHDGSIHLSQWDIDYTQPVDVGCATTGAPANGYCDQPELGQDQDKQSDTDQPTEAQHLDGGFDGDTMQRQQQQQPQQQQQQQQQQQDAVRASTASGQVLGSKPASSTLKFKSRTSKFGRRR
jgi:hypothetical protein